jgi:hypothetical protein
MTLKKIIFKVARYIILRYFIYLVALYLINTDAKFVKLSDLKNGNDFFYCFWLFGVPVLLDFVINGLPMAYVIYKISHLNSFCFYLLIALLFIIEFSLGNWIYGYHSAMIKITVSSILFVVLFYKYLYKKNTKVLVVGH